jgi:predicted transcriptional regulator
MDLQAEKLKLVQAVLNIEDINLVKAVEEFLIGQEMDWFDELSDEQQQSVIRGLEQADKGETITHREAIARFGL